MKKWSINLPKRLLSILLSVLMIATSAIVTGLSTVSAETLPTSSSDETTVFEDDFNRSDRDINGDNSWISSYSSAQSSHKIVDNCLSVEDYSDQNGIATCYTKRPDTEAAISQRVSVDIKNPNTFTYFSSANVHVRYVADANSVGPAQNYYVAVTQQSIKIGKICGDWSPSSTATKALDNGGGEVFYVYNANNDYRIELIAEGTTPTTLTATLYDKTAGVAVATVSGTDYQSELQQEGTVALSTKRNASGQDTALFDNFRYEYLKTVSESEEYKMAFKDDLTRTDGTLGNDWNIGNYARTSFNDDNELLLTSSHVNDSNTYIPESALMRPTSEASLNQTVSVDFESLATGAERGAFLIARCQGDRPTTDNCYSAGLFDSDTTNLRLWIYIGAGGTSISSKQVAITDFTNGLPANTKYHLEFTVTSTNATTTNLVAKLYSFNDDNSLKLIYTQTATDSTPALQNPGTVGFSVRDRYGKDFRFKNFCFTPINGWNAGSCAKTSVADDGKLLLTSSHVNDGNAHHIPESALMRPTSEASLNQTVSVDFESLATGDNRGAFLIARCQGDRPIAENCYSAGLFDSDTINLRLWIYKGAGNTRISNTESISVGEGGLPANTKYHLEFTVTSIDENTTKLVAKLYSFNNDGSLKLIYTQTATDSTFELQNPGTVGISVRDTHGNNFWFDNFSYAEVNDTQDFSFEKDNSIYKTFEAEQAETQRYNYNKTSDVDGASDKSAAIQNKLITPTSYETITDSLNDKGGYIVYNITADAAGTYPIKMRYKFGCNNQSDYNNAIGTDNAPYAAVIVNGQKYKFNATAWNEFSTTISYDIPLQAGNNTIYCMSPTSEMTEALPGAYIDYDCLLVSGDVKVTAGNMVICGDVNCDDTINLLDLVRIKKHIANSPTYIEEQLADINNDNLTDGNDIVKLVKCLLDVLNDSEKDEFSWLKFVETDYPTKSEMLKNTYYKLKVDKKLNVGFLGGSVTVGQMASTTGDVADTPWRQLTFDWLKKQYPDATLTQINGAVGGTGSSFGLQNYVEKLHLDNPNERPDLVFIEYAVNDYYNGENAASVKNNMEWLIRGIYSYVPDADIVIVLTGEYTNLNLDYETKVAHRWIAERFRLPCISVAEMLWDDMVAENNGNKPSNTQWLKYFSNPASPNTFDWVHLNNDGYKKYAGYVTDYLDSIFTAKEGVVPDNTVNSFVPISLNNEKKGEVPIKTGDYEFLDNTVYKLTKDEKLNVAYFGGSITYGTGADPVATNSWRALTTKWLRETYPNAQITENNAAIGGTGTAFGIYRAVSHLKLTSETQKPDLVFIDFAINDVYDNTDYATAKSNMEAIVRTIYEYAPQAEIIMLLTTDGVRTNTAYDQFRAHKEVAEKFGLPCIAIGQMLWNDEGGYANWSTNFLPDNVHPNNSGHAKYANYVISYLENTFNAKTGILASAEDIDISDIVIGDNLPGKAWFETFEGQTAPAGMEIYGTGINAGILKTSSGTTTADFTIKFTGTDLSFWVYETTTSGDISVSVDGGEAITKSLYRNGDAPKIVPIVSGLEDAEHTVRVTLSPSSHGSYMQIHGCMIKSETNEGIVLSSAS